MTTRNKRIAFCCDYCGKVSSDKPSHYLRKQRHFCSMGCYSKFRAELLPKEEQHAFGKGHPQEERIKRAKARSDLNHALRSGRVVGPLPCEICFSTHDIEAHHDDYSKPLEVRWLCFKHHRALHNEHPELLEAP